MADFFTKPVDDITLKDVRDLAGRAESLQFEIKQDLPGSMPGDPDWWHQDPALGGPRKGPRDKAKREIFEELVAFANTEGGSLVLGIEEAGTPTVAGKIRALPECEELAARLRQAAVDWTDPPLRGVLAAGAPSRNDGGGVVILRVPRSPERPHRLKEGGQWRAFRRVDHESKAMSMREIHDMVRERDRETSAVEAAFSDARQYYAELQPPGGGRRRLLGYQVIAVPLSGPLSLDRPYLNEALFERQDGFRLRFADGQKQNVESISLRAAGATSPPVRPGLRAGLKDGSGELVNDRRYFWQVRVDAAGAISSITKFEPANDGPRMHADYIIADAANVLNTVDRVRLAAVAPDATYGLEILLRYDEHYPDQRRVQPVESGTYQMSLDPFSAAQQQLHSDITTLGRYEIGSATGFSDVLANVVDDLLNLCGQHHLDGLKFTI